MMEFRLLDTGPRDAATNMALDEILVDLISRGASPPTLRFLEFSPDAALVGYNQELDRELRLDYCRTEGIQVNRRLTGGGALLFQEHALGWELIAPSGTGPFGGGFDAALTRICHSAARGLGRLGVDVRYRPRNDLETDGRKISGTGGVVWEQGVLFQGTVLVRNEIERFLKALRVPVEKLKKREIESLLDRMAFLEDLLGRKLELAEIKQALAEQFSQDLKLTLKPSGLTATEQAALSRRLPYFQSDDWIDLKRGRNGRPAWLRNIHQTDEGVVTVNLWLDHSGRLVQKALISGDFFSRPQRLIRDLEAGLIGVKANPDALQPKVLELLEEVKGEFLGIPGPEIARAVAEAGARKSLAAWFSETEAAELFLVGLAPDQVGREKIDWLLLPYCSKPLECEYRPIPDCGRCGDCLFAPLYDLADDLGLRCVSIQSFEHLMVVLKEIAALGQSFTGSCCEAFYRKHRLEMETSGAPGVLVNLDSTTCYDLGKGMEAYQGKYDHQTELNEKLLSKVSRVMAGGR